MECVRIITENNEKQMLSQYATLSANTQGRKREEEKWNISSFFVFNRLSVVIFKGLRVFSDLNYSF